jgi:hypothetical protein
LGSLGEHTWTGERKRHFTSRYLGVYWSKVRSTWTAQLYDPQVRRSQYIGSSASEEDAARAYDFAAVQARGPGTKRNFPGEDIRELPATVGDERKQRSSSRYVGVSWHKARSSWQVQLRDPQTSSRHIGYYASEEDAARAFDFAAVQARGPGAERNFPGEAISDLPVSVVPYKERTSSRYIGVTWHKTNSSWLVQLMDPQTSSRHIGYYASEEDAARAYDCAAVQAHGPGVKRNFPGETVSELPASDKQKPRSSSRFIGVHLQKSSSSWIARLRGGDRTDPQTKLYIGSYASEEGAARAYDRAVFQAHGPGAELNFPGEVKVWLNCLFYY